MHTLIVGSNEMPRRELIDRILNQLAPCPPLYSYRSVKEAPDETGNAPIYIYPAAGVRIRRPENLLGWCRDRQATAYPQVFERYAYLIEQAEKDGLLLLDEIGPMESRSPRFCSAVQNALDGEIPILASVRTRTHRFLPRCGTIPKQSVFILPKRTSTRFILLHWPFCRPNLTKENHRRVRKNELEFK